MKLWCGLFGNVTILLTYCVFYGTCIAAFGYTWGKLFYCHSVLVEGRQAGRQAVLVLSPLFLGGTLGAFISTERKQVSPCC